ncbi:calcium:hydrogen antiporter [Mycena floridula]|nr:calcium:hydrogen antiporter [Mycena floridula]
MDPNEHTALLNGRNSRPNSSIISRASALFKAEGEPSWINSYKFFLFGSYLNVLLLFIPLSVLSHYLNWDAALRFSFSFIAIIPLAKLLGEATEQMSTKLGQTLAGLLNASFGNAVEIIVGIAALLQGELVIVQNSMLGSILSNILLVLGCSFLAGGMKFKESNFQVTAAQASSSLMTLACITLVIPAAYNNLVIDSTHPSSQEGLLIISRGTALILLGVYVAYLYFQLKSHAYLFQADDEEEPEAPKMSIVAASSALLIVTVITSFVADYLVASIEEFAERYSIPKPFIGLILLPIVANAAEHVTSVWMAMKGQMELTIGICVGSSIQIATFVVPLLVIIGWISKHELTLFFANFETIVLFVSVFLVNTLIQDGKSNYMEGLMLVSLYFVIALACKRVFNSFICLLTLCLSLGYLDYLHHLNGVEPFVHGNNIRLGSDKMLTKAATSFAASSVTTIMNFDLKYLPHTISEWDVTREFAKILHSQEFNPDTDNDERKLNFEVKLNANEKMGVRNDGSGILTLPLTWGNKFLRYIQGKSFKIQRNKIKIYKSLTWPSRPLATKLEKTQYTSPDLEAERQSKNQKLEDAFRVDCVQFGVLYQDSYPKNGQRPPPRKYSIEWEKDYTRSSTAWLRFEYDHKLIRITLGDPMTEEQGVTIAVSLSSITRLGVGYDGSPYIVFDTITPPVLEEIEFNAPIIGYYDDDHQKLKHRVGSLMYGHERVSPFAQKLRVQLYHDQNQDMIAKFKSFCITAGLSESVIAVFPPGTYLDASRRNFFSEKILHRLRKTFAQFSWSVAWQLEALLHNCLLNTEEMDALLPVVKKLCESDNYKEDDCAYVGQLLQRYGEGMETKPAAESPLACFQRIQSDFAFGARRVPAGNFLCCHVTMCPSRMLLEGPYPSQSNRVIRQYQGYEEHFIRVEFRDEDRLQFRWDREVDGTAFLQDRVGGILRHGFTLGGREFEFLAYSTSALREHSVWFLHRFQHPTGVITAERIRSSLGNFEGTELLQCPSKYAARLAQAFTATDPSVAISKGEWEEVDDLGDFTDGVGTISSKLGDRIWKALCEQHPRSTDTIQPSIRFLGFKGVVGVDRQLDNHPAGIQMRLRHSMKKFESKDVEEAHIEIARAFERPNMSYLNKALVMLLETRGVQKDYLMELQHDAVAEARTIHDTLEKFHTTLRAHSLGSGYRLSSLLQRLDKLGCGLSGEHKKHNIDGPFLRQIRQIAMTDMLREIKHGARIKIPDSFLLVGVADEGVAYEQAGYTNVYTLPEGHIYACIQNADDAEPTYLEGSCSISRSPVCHPGDVQRVYAIGKPPADQLCLFAHLKNVVVLPCVVNDSCCLGLTDPSRDIYDIIMCPELLPPVVSEAASYPPGETLNLSRDSTVDDICDFIVEYIHSDVLGLLSDRLLVIADESKDGMNDEKCIKLAAMCSQAVDYPKLGKPVPVDDLPSKYLRSNPDWHAAEVARPRQTDYYFSSRALGHMYRDITIEDPDSIDKELHDAEQASKGKPLNDPISSHVQPIVQSYIQDGAVDVDTLMPGIRKSFDYYCDELRYCSLTHTVSNTPGARLLESELVTGTILAKCSQRRWRKDRIWRMRLCCQTLVNGIRQDLWNNATDPQGYIRALQKCWYAWDYSLRNQSKFGAPSFGLICLGIILECLEKLETAVETIEQTETVEEGTEIPDSEEFEYEF